MTRDKPTIRNKSFKSAPFLTAKAYRGVAYVPSRREDPGHSVELRHFLYRGQSYRH
jgi:hypothetical protein